MGKRPSIISDIANTVGVSNATVSRVLSGSNYPVSESLRTLILETAKQTDHYDQILEKNLNKHPLKDIGIIIPTITNPFFNQLIAGVSSEAIPREFVPTICCSNRSLQIEQMNLKFLLQKKTAGIILHSTGDDLSFLKDVLEYNSNIVLLNQNTENLHVHSVQFDFFEAGYMATEYLLLRGHERIAFLSPPIDRIGRKESLEGYYSVLSAFKIAIRPEYIISAESEIETENKMYEYENGKMLVQAFLELPERPTAIFTINDLTAYGIICELDNAGVRVPQDVSVIGLDNLDFSMMFNPSLTTVNQPAYETGRLAAKILLDNIHNPQGERVKVILRPSIVERNSVRTLY